MNNNDIRKTPHPQLLAECIWELLSFIERTAGDIDGLTELHDFVKPRVESLLRPTRRKRLIQWLDEESDVPLTDNTPGPQGKTD